MNTALIFHTLSAKLSAKWLANRPAKKPSRAHIDPVFGPAGFESASAGIFTDNRSHSSYEIVADGGSPGEIFACRVMPHRAARSKCTRYYKQATYAPESTLYRGVPHPAKLCQKRPFIYGVQQLDPASGQVHLSISRWR
jgi:hypothetical protein